MLFKIFTAHVLATCLLPLLCAATPTPMSSDLQSRSTSSFGILNFVGCHQPAVSSIPVPTGQATINVPSGVSAVRFAMAGRGIQNYTCSKGTYQSIGALADLFDVSCIANMSLVNQISELLLAGLKFPYKSAEFPVAMNHFFVATPGGWSGVSPVFATASEGSVFSVYQKLGALNSPDDMTKDVTSLQLDEIEEGPYGGISTAGYRLHTAGGQPPASCDREGALLSVDYAALYYFAN